MRQVVLSLWGLGIWGQLIATMVMISKKYATMKLLSTVLTVIWIPGAASGRGGN